VSSSRIRKLVQEGQIEQANALLGHDHFLFGEVIKGDERGAALGFPTANINMDAECVPAFGVYASILEDCESGHFYLSVSNIGTNPSFEKSSAPLKIESHLPQFSGNLYGRSVRLFLLARIRDEQKFDSVNDLKQQIERDLQDCYSVFIDRNFLRDKNECIASNLEKPVSALQNYQAFKMIDHLSKI
jgi:riboflavin kinase/FMN adenylyltransferase